MPAIRSAPATRQPQQPQINRGNRLGAKVIEHISLNGRIRALVAGTYGTLGPSGAIAATPKGIGLRGTGASARGSIVLDLSAKSKITMAFSMYWDTFANDDALAMEFGSSYTAESGIMIDPNASGVGGNFLVGVGNPGGSNLVTFNRPSAGAWHRIVFAFDRNTGTAPSTAVWVDGVRQAIATPLTATATTGNFANTTLNLFSRAGASLFGTGNLQDITIYDGLLSDGEAAEDYRNPYQIFRNPQARLLFDAPAGGTDTPINPAVGALALTGYSPTIAQSVNQAFTPAAGSLTLTGYAPSVAQSSAAAVNPGAGSLVLTGYAPTITQPQAIAPGAGSLSITGFAPSVTQGITTAIAPGAGSLAFTGYAPSVAQSANQTIAPTPGTLAITGYAPTLAQTANQSILPAVGSLVIAGYAPTVAQALASPNLTPGAGVLSIIGYAPSVVQAAPVTKIGGDDVPRDEDERIEIWEPRKPQPKRDDSLDKVVREAYAKATGKPIAAAVAKPGPSVRAPDPDPFDYDEDDFEVLLLSY